VLRVADGVHLGQERQLSKRRPASSRKHIRSMCNSEL
jgi:hypothetical protein